MNLHQCKFCRHWSMHRNGYFPYLKWPIKPYKWLAFDLLKNQENSNFHPQDEIGSRKLYLQLISRSVPYPVDTRSEDTID